MLRLLKRAPIVISALLVISIGLGLVAFLGRTKSEPAPTQPGIVSKQETLGQPPLHDDQEPGFVGVILPSETVDVSPSSTGRLDSVKVRLGDRFRAGDVIASLDSSTAQLEADVASAALRAVQAEKQKLEIQLEEARRRLQRVELLADVVSSQERSDAKAAERLAVAALDEVRARADAEAGRMAQLNETLAKTVMRAPFDGQVAARYKDPGVIIAAATPIVRLIRTGPLLVRFAVPERNVADFSIGQVVTVKFGNPQAPLTATVERMSPEADPASGMVVVEAVLNSAPIAPHGGMTVRVLGAAPAPSAALP